jgi:hypothetical protein
MNKDFKIDDHTYIKELHKKIEKYINDSTLEIPGFKYNEAKFQEKLKELKSKKPISECTHDELMSLYEE